MNHRELLDDLHKLEGTGPYAGVYSNPCYADAAFAAFLERKYGMSITELRKRVKKDEQKAKAY